MPDSKAARCAAASSLRQAFVVERLDVPPPPALIWSYTGKEDDPAYEFRQLFVPQYRST